MATSSAAGTSAPGRRNTDSGFRRGGRRARPGRASADGPTVWRRKVLDARTLYQEGKLSEAIAALNAEVRDRPTDVQRRTFLFELLCFAGDYERARKQLDVLARWIPRPRWGSWRSGGVLECEQERREMFDRRVPSRTSGQGPGPCAAGSTVSRSSGWRTRTRASAPRLEIFLGGQYSWIPLEHLTPRDRGAPQRLRDLLWCPGHAPGRASLESVDFGGALLIPALTPAAWRDEDDLVRLGRVTRWVGLGDGLRGAGGPEDAARGRRGLPDSGVPRARDRRPVGRWRADSHALPEGLLAPISEERPGGSRGHLRGRLRPRRDAPRRAAMPEHSFEEVAELATQILEKRVEGPHDRGLAHRGVAEPGRASTGSTPASGCIAGLVRPVLGAPLPRGVEDRAFTLEFVGEGFTTRGDRYEPVKFVPLTDWGHHLYHFEEWRGRAQGLLRRRGPEEGEGEEEGRDDEDPRAPTSENFESGFAETPKAALQGAPRPARRLRRGRGAPRGAGQGALRGAEGPEAELRQAEGGVARVTTAVQVLLDKKLELEPDPVGRSSPGAGSDGGDPRGLGGARRAPGGAGEAPPQPSGLSPEPDGRRGRTPPRRERGTVPPAGRPH